MKPIKHYGKWRVRWKENGKRHSATFTFKKNADKAIEEIKHRLDEAKLASLSNDEKHEKSVSESVSDFVKSDKMQSNPLKNSSF